MDDLSLAADFPTATREQWMARVENVLKGADFSKKLVGRTYDGIAIEPLYPKAEHAQALGRAQVAPWLVSQRLDHPDPVIANELALADLEGGANALTIVMHDAPAAHGFGLKAETLDDLDRALAGVMLDLIHIRLDAGVNGPGAAQMLIDLAEWRGHDLPELSLDLGIDPIGALAASGSLSAPWDQAARSMSETLADLTSRGFRGRAFLADGRPYHEAGASEAQELAAVLATALAYLRALEANGHELDQARNALSFLLVADADEFLTIAKFRALRRLWARIEQSCGLDPKPLRLHAETAWRMTTRRDPWVNMLRTTIAAFSAGIGGADAITVLPFTAALGLPDAFARRVARNTQHVLLDEANLWRVNDPAAGAGGFEALTDALCEKAWGLFQDIERDGGILESLNSGQWQERIAAVRAQRDKAIATRRDPITGTSEFPHITEMDVMVLMPLPESRRSDRALPSLRSAEPFERLRDRSDERLKQGGQRPKVFLANLGPISAFTARSTFARNVFEAGGIEAVTNDGFASMQAMVKAYRDSGAVIACLCSSDEIYETHAVEAAQALAAAGAGTIYLAGRPGAFEAGFRDAGVSEFIFAGCDSIKLLTGALDAASA